MQKKLNFNHQAIKHAAINLFLHQFLGVFTAYFVG